MAALAQLVRHCPVYGKVASLILSEHMIGFWAQFTVGGMHGAVNQRLTLTLMFLSPCLSPKKSIKIFKEKIEAYTWHKAQAGNSVSLNVPPRGGARAFILFPFSKLLCQIILGGRLGLKVLFYIVVAYLGMFVHISGNFVWQVLRWLTSLYSG